MNALVTGVRALSIATFVIGCGNPPSRTDGAVGDKPRANAKEVVVFTGREATSNLWRLGACDRNLTSAISSTWTPDSVVVAEIERSLPLRFDSAQRDLRTVPIARLNFAQYYRQYLGVIRNRRRLVIVNGVRTDYARMVEREVQTLADRGDTIDIREGVWRRVVMMPCDAGVAHFVGMYDTGRRTIVSFAFSETMNGPP